MLLDFLNNFQSVVISTLNEDKTPFTSYAPFIKKDSKYYVYISTMARHTRNMEKDNNTSLFFVEDEKTAGNIFARKRVVLECNSKRLARDNDKFEELMDNFEEVHGKTVQMLRGMKDFSIYEFQVKGGEAIFGFGEAYDVGGENFEQLIERSNQKGHGHTTK